MKTINQIKKKQLDIDQKYMQYCINMAKAGIAQAAPNPSVGAILVYKDEIIGKGFTSKYGGPHAEVNCIGSVAEINKHKIQGATLYVSLEPCSHIGKTPACSRLIIEKKISQVVIGSIDPNPLVAGKGIAMLKQKGIKIKCGVLEKSCQIVNRRFYTFHRKKRPYIILKWAETKNGFFSPEDDLQFWITNRYSKQLVHKWRSEEMAILVGTKTAEIDNPQLNSRLYKGSNPLRIVIDKQLKLDSNIHLFDQSTPTLVFNLIETRSQTNIEFIKIPQEGFLKSILHYLYTINIQSLIIEGGLITLNEFIQQNLWDEKRVLIGSNLLKNGRIAPQKNGHQIEHFSLKTDEIKILLNPNEQ